MFRWGYVNMEKVIYCLNILFHADYFFANPSMVRGRKASISLWRISVAKLHSFWVTSFQSAVVSWRSLTLEGPRGTFVNLLSQELTSLQRSSNSCISSFSLAHICFRSILRPICGFFLKPFFSTLMSAMFLCYQAAFLTCPYRVKRKTFLQGRGGAQAMFRRDFCGAELLLSQGTWVTEFKSFSSITSKMAMCGGTGQLRQADKEVQQICDQVNCSSVFLCLHTTLDVVSTTLTILKEQPRFGEPVGIRTLLRSWDEGTRPDFKWL